MMSHVTVEEEVPRQLLTKPGTALGLKIAHLGRTDHLNVDAV